MRVILVLVLAGIFLAGCGGSPARSAPSDPEAAVINRVIQEPASRAAHEAWLPVLKGLEDADETEIANEQIIIDAFDNQYPQSMAPIHHGLPAVLNHQAWHLTISGKRVMYAEALVTEALKLQPDECDFLDTLAELRFRQGRAGEAVDIIRKALEQTMDRGRPMGKSKRKYLEEQCARFEKE